MAASQGPTGCQGRQPEDQEQPLVALIVDDEPDFLTFVKDALEEHDIGTVCATSVEEAVRALQSRSDLEVVITDMIMPEQNGCDLLHFIRENLRFTNLPVLVCSGYPSKQWLGKALSLGAVDYLAKPVSIQTLVTRVRRAVQLATRTILLVTPDPLLSGLLSRTLSRSGFRLFHARSGREALEMIERERINAIVSALALSDMSGLDLLVHIKENCPGIPVLFLTDRHTKVAPEDLIAAGADGTIMQPFTNLDVIKQVRAVVHIRPAALTRRTNIVRRLLDLEQ